MRSGIGGYLLIILLVMMLFGVVSLGDVLSVIFYIIMGVIALVVIVALLLRGRMRKIRRQMENGATQSRGEARRENKKDGEVTVRQTAAHEKVVRGEVGDYVEYEEVTETTTEE